METMYKIAAAVIGAVLSFFTGMPLIVWALIGVMTLDYATGIICAAAGKSTKTEGGKLSSGAAFMGLLKKMMMLVLVLLAALLDFVVRLEVGITFSAVTGAVCLWFIASEGISIVENAAELGLPIPKVLTRALEIMKRAGDGEEDRPQDEQGRE